MGRDHRQATGGGPSWWAWAAVPLFASAVAAGTLVVSTLAYGFTRAMMGQRGGSLLGFVCGPLVFLLVGCVWWWAAGVGWRWVGRRAISRPPSDDPTA